MDLFYVPSMVRWPIEAGSPPRGGRFCSTFDVDLFDRQTSRSFVLTFSSSPPSFTSFLHLLLNSLPLTNAALSRPPSLPDVAATPGSVPVRTRPQRTLSRPSSYSSGLGDIAERRNSSGSGGNGNAGGGGGGGAATGGATGGTNAGGKPARTRPTNNQLL